MACQFCNHSTPHGCWTADEAAGCGNYAASREDARRRREDTDEVERVIAALAKRPTAAQIEKAERRELARLKAKYEANDINGVKERQHVDATAASRDL